MPRQLKDLKGKGGCKGNELSIKINFCDNDFFVFLFFFIIQMLRFHSINLKRGLSSLSSLLKIFGLYLNSVKKMKSLLMNSLRIMRIQFIAYYK